jgi:hypothetical protein
MRLELLKHCDELGLFGDEPSSGMQKELEAANSLRPPGSLTDQAYFYINVKISTPGAFTGTDGVKRRLVSFATDRHSV